MSNLLPDLSTFSHNLTKLSWPGPTGMFMLAPPSAGRREGLEFVNNY